MCKKFNGVDKNDDLIHDIMSCFRAHRSLDRLLLNNKQKRALEHIRSKIAYSRGSAREMKQLISDVLSGKAY